MRPFENLIVHGACVKMGADIHTHAASSPSSVRHAPARPAAAEGGFTAVPHRARSLLTPVCVAQRHYCAAGAQQRRVYVVVVLGWLALGRRGAGR